MVHIIKSNDMTLLESIMIGGIAVGRSKREGKDEGGENSLSLFLWHFFVGVQYIHTVCMYILCMYHMYMYYVMWSSG
jgi:hypothetical protein